MKKIYKFDFSKYSYVIDEENHEFKIFRFNEEDITDKVMSNPLLDLMLAYDNLKEEYDKLHVKMNFANCRESMNNKTEGYNNE